MSDFGSPARKPSLLRQVFSLPANFWFANFMEIFERLAFFGVRAIAPLYLVAKANDNGLSLSYADKGNIYMWWALIQCLVPMVSGGYTERYGYRKSLVVAFLINITGYICMAQSLPISQYFGSHGWSGAGYWVFLFAACLVALGTAIFKPPVHGTIAKTTDEETSSMGWGLFYWVVNIGGALAPMLAAQLRGEINWQYVFYGAAIVTAFNFVPLFLLYREPPKSPEALAAAEERKGPVATFTSSIGTILRDPRLVVFLLIFSCFWLMFMQLWDLLPNFIDEWVDTSGVAPFFAFFNKGWVLDSGQTKPEMLININSISIIALVLFISWLIRKLNKVAAMVLGMIIAMVGFVLAGMTMVGWFCCLMILVFSIGEMTCSPTFSAYVGLIAPKDKKALYMGYSNIPFAIGWAIGNLVGGYFYDAYGARAKLAYQYLASDTVLLAKAAQASDWSDNLEDLPPLLGVSREDAFGAAEAAMSRTPEAAADELRAVFHYDRGQLENLALLKLALNPEKRPHLVAGLADAVAKQVDALGVPAAFFKQEVSALVADAHGGSAPAGQTTQPATAPTTAPTQSPSLLSAAPLLRDMGEIRDLIGLVEELMQPSVALESVPLGRYVHILPTALGVERGDAIEAVQKQLNESRGDAEKLDFLQTLDVLWSELGSRKDVLDNLALEYLAQGTDQLREGVASMQFRAPPKQMELRLSEVKARVGITESDAFGALSAALGEGGGAASQPASETVYVHIATQPQLRYEAIRRHDWPKETTLLREFIRSDPNVAEFVRAHIDEEGWLASLTKLFGAKAPQGQMTEEGINYAKLAANSDLLRQALARKDWAATPGQAAQLVLMNPFEARTLIDANQKEAQRVLWDAYRPWMVWVFLGLFGLAGTIGMIIFYFATRKAIRTDDALGGQPM